MDTRMEEGKIYECHPPLGFPYVFLFFWTFRENLDLFVLVRASPLLLHLRFRVRDI